MKIALIGYGKMGKAIEKIALEGGHTVTAVVSDESELGKLAESDVDLAIEFTQPDSAFINVSHCLNLGITVISGTTGWQDKLETIETLCIEKGGTFLWASNFSIGVNLFFELNKWLAAKMSKLDFKPSMEEIHHTEKKDSPSGTAITLAEGIIASHSSMNEWINDESTDHKKLGIVSLRTPNVPGTHTVSYSSPLESIEITHTAHDRSVFAEGVIKVGEWIQNKKGVFTISDFINDN